MRKCIGKHSILLLFGLVMLALLLPGCSSERTIEYEGGTYTGEVFVRVPFWGDGMPHGYGTWEHPDDGIYKGEWRDGLFHGQGTYTLTDGSVYEGEFKDGLQRQGTLTFGTDSQWAGDSYEGEFKDYLFHGQGIYTFADGSVYEGEFKDGLFHGQGTYTYTWPDGKKETGKWEYGEYIGP